MKKRTIILIQTLILSFNLSFSQTKTEIDSLLEVIGKTKQSKFIVETSETKQIMTYKETVLSILADFFTDSTLVNTNSICNNRILTKGELALIIADRIEPMPYFTLTGIQNCLLTFCENNPNLIEYYLDFIRRDGKKNFQLKYSNWLMSDERKDWTPLFAEKTKKKK